MTIQDVFEAVGAHAAGTMSAAELHELEGVACPGAGACGGQFTANTMAMALEFLGIGPRGPERHPGARPGEGARRRSEAGELVMRLVRDDVRPVARSSRARRSRTPSPAIAATGGSTNGVLHLLAIARELGVAARRSTTSTTIAERTPVVADLKPGGRYVATDLHAAGGVALVARELAEAAARPRATRRTSTAARSAEIADAAVETPRPGGRRRRSSSR